MMLMLILIFDFVVAVVVVVVVDKDDVDNIVQTGHKYLDKDNLHFDYLKMESVFVDVHNDVVKYVIFVEAQMNRLLMMMINSLMKMVMIVDRLVIND